jgi:ElaB/YqjD/DUF883 family membrane-anchored ribosome-binding protein
MEERLTDNTLTREQALDVARHVGETALDEGRQQAQKAGAMASNMMEQAKAMARDVGEQARAAAADPGATAQDLARRAREQAAVASDALYQQGMRAGEYLTENVNEYPLTALLLAAAIGYGIAFLIHARWQSPG